LSGAFLACVLGGISIGAVIVTSGGSPGPLISMHFPIRSMIPSGIYVQVSILEEGRKDRHDAKQVADGLVLETQ
jgi:hypothetical protein